MILNTPDDGNCGFYATAIALIDIIQKEYYVNKSSKTFARWQELGLEHIKLEELLALDLEQLSHNLTLAKAKLQPLQHSLRMINMNDMRQDLFTRIAQEQPELNGSAIISSDIFSKFMGLVHYYNAEPDSREFLHELAEPNFNELALDAATVALAQNTAKEIKAKQSAVPDFENDYGKKVLLADVLTTQQQVNPNSIILQGLQHLTANGRWATHEDLKRTLSAFNLNFCVNDVNDGSIDPQKQSATLNNVGNGHWQTVVNAPLRHTKPLPPVTRPNNIDDVIALTAKTQPLQEKVAQYKQNLHDLIDCALEKGLFHKVQNKIDPRNLDTAQAAENETDEDFAARLQEAELRRVFK